MIKHAHMLLILPRSYFMFLFLSVLLTFPFFILSCLSLRLLFSLLLMPLPPYTPASFHSLCFIAPSLYLKPPFSCHLTLSVTFSPRSLHLSAPPLQCHLPLLTLSLLFLLPLIATCPLYTLHVLNHSLLPGRGGGGRWGLLIKVIYRETWPRGSNPYPLTY